VSVGRRVGRRGAYLLVKSVIYAGHGVLYLLVPPTPALAETLRLPLALAPLWVWGLAWTAAAAVAAGCAFRQGPRADRWGFQALIIMASTWAGCYLAAALVGFNTATFARGAVGALLYAALGGTVLVVAGWPECKDCGR
jgi:hypothetical protein